MMNTAYARMLPVALLALLAAGCEQRSGATPTESTPFSATESGEHSKDIGDYVIHFNAFSTDHLAPEIAKTYKIQRSQSRAMLNVTVIRKVDGTIGEPVKADVQARTTNLTGQLKTLELRELIEGDAEAIYYVGDLPVANGETLIFDISVTPAGETETHAVKFKRRFSY